MRYFRKSSAACFPTHVNQYFEISLITEIVHTTDSESATVNHKGVHAIRFQRSLRAPVVPPRKPHVGMTPPPIPPRLRERVIHILIHFDYFTNEN